MDDFKTQEEEDRFIRSKFLHAGMVFLTGGVGGAFLAGVLVTANHWNGLIITLLTIVGMLTVGSLASSMMLLSTYRLMGKNT